MTHSENVYNDHLKELHSSEFEMAKGEPDIRHWKVVGLQNQEVGRVEELLFNEVSHRVRYLVVNLNGKPLNLISRSILIPVGLVDLLREEKVVLLNGINIAHLASLPAYEKGKVSRDTELAVRDVFSSGYVGEHKGKDLVDDEDDYFNNGRFAHPRMEVSEKSSAKEEIRENLEQVRESVRKMENQIERLNGSGL